MIRPASLSRRRFLQASSVAAAAAVVPSSVARAVGARGASHVLVPGAGRWSDPDRRALAAMAIDAARAGGASYADVRLSCTRSEQWTLFAPTVPAMQDERMGVGLRVLVNGAWGFASSGRWTPDEMARLARVAIGCATANGSGARREIVLAPTPVVNGEWTMPVAQDPFRIPNGEKYDFFNHLNGVVQRYDPVAAAAFAAAVFSRAETVFASSEGSSWAQTTYLSESGLTYFYDSEPGNRKFYSGDFSPMTTTIAGRGWEYFTESGLIESVPDMVRRAQDGRDMTSVDVGRYDLVCSASATAALLDGSIGAATELDRAMGYEADGDGTSYLDRPLEMLGTQVMGSRLLTVTANRSVPGGAATVKWDDEGVAPDDFALVRDGVLVDFQTTREQVAWLAPYYEKNGRANRSHGCSASYSGAYIPMQHRPNLQMRAGAEESGFADLVSGTKTGIALLTVNEIRMDQQQLNGTVLGVMREIRNGKLGRIVNGAGLAFRAPEFWKTLDAIGGASSLQWVGQRERKGDPVQLSAHSVGAVPARFRGAAIIDFYRKA